MKIIYWKGVRIMMEWVFIWIFIYRDFLFIKLMLVVYFKVSDVEFGI